MAPAEMARGAHWFTAGALRRRRQAARLPVAATRPLRLLMRLLAPTWVKAPVR